MPSTPRVPSSMSKKKPLLRGKICVAGSTVSISGHWKLATTPFSQKVSEEAPPFELVCVKELPESITGIQTLFSPTCVELDFQGSFSTYSKKNERAERQEKIHYDDDVHIKFCKIGPQKFDLVGSGRNEFGTFLVEGKLDIPTQELYMTRNYFSEKKERTSIKRRRPRKPKLPLKRVCYEDSLFDISKLVGPSQLFKPDEIDPLISNPAAELPDQMVVPDFDMGLDDPFKSEEFDNIDFGCLVQVKGICNFGANDLKDMDARLLKKLNEVGDFSCPSKR